MRWTAASSPRFYMLQYGLPRHAKRAHRFAHRQEAIAGLTIEAGLEVFGEANTPGGAGCQLLAWDDAVIEQAMDGRWRNAERGRGLLILIVSGSPSGAPAVGSKQGIPQW